MSHSIDLRKRVVDYVEGGGSKAEAARRFSVSLWCVNDWMTRKGNLKPRRPGPKSGHKLDWEALREAVAARPDAMLKEHAARFGTGTTTIWHALRRMGLSRKKNRSLQTEKEV